MRQKTTQRRAGADSAIRNPQSPIRRAFTLVELLVVITIIGILAALLLAAVGPAVDAANRARIRAELTQFDTAFEDIKNNVGSYPPNAQTDRNVDAILDSDRVLSNFRRHFLKAFPNHREPPTLIEGLCGWGTVGDPTNLENGMNAAESLVFWLGGFSDDPKYPISGPGGPSYRITATGVGADLDPIANRSWRLGIDVGNLGPRDETTDFFPAGYPRFVEYNDPRPGGALRRINFWFLNGPGTESPYVYFDASRGSSATADNDAPAGVRTTDYTNAGVAAGTLAALPRVYAVKALATGNDPAQPFVYANDGKFQILHAGTDNTWGDFPRISPTADASSALLDWLLEPIGNAPLPLYFPNGPWGIDARNTLSNFTDGTLEDAQP